MAHGLLRSSDDLSGNVHGRVKREKEVEIMLAQNEKVTIIPQVQMDKFEMASGIFGPFLPMTPVSVPLYVALFLRHSLLCIIQAPEWLSIRSLQKSIENEEISPNEFTSISMYMFENAETYLESCDIPENITELKILVKQLKEIRLKKLLKGVEYIDSPMIGMNNLTFYEFRKIKEYIIPHLEIQKALSNEEK